jgi:tRNA pseudouridine38-40 synthase
MTRGDPALVRTLKLTIAYDGANYAGWQSQLARPTVQDMLENAIEKVTGQRVRVLASGRTDAGVHALGQVVGLRCESRLPPNVLLRALNANLPDDIAVLEAADAPVGFHAIADVIRKRYRYVIYDGTVRDVFGRRYAWHYPYGRLDAAAMQRAALALVGKHDFRSFESSGAERKTSVRTVFQLRVERGGDCPNFRGHRSADVVGGKGTVPLDAENARTALPGKKIETGPQGRAGGGEFLPTANGGDYVFMDIEADGFLYNMVRAIVGTLVEVGRGAEREAWPGEVLQALDRRVAGPTAPPHGLCLVNVEYRQE